MGVLLVLLLETRAPPGLINEVRPGVPGREELRLRLCVSLKRLIVPVMYMERLALECDRCSVVYL